MVEWGRNQPMNSDSYMQNPDNRLVKARGGAWEQDGRGQ